VNCLRWIAQQGHPLILAYGTGLGYLELWQQNDTQVRYNPVSSTAQLALGTRDGVIQVYKIGTVGELHSLFSVSLENVVPINVGFFDNAVKDVFVFGMFCGQKCV
jgi:hypothetical protein